MRKEKIRSIEFTAEGCVLNGGKPIPVKMPAEVSPPGSIGRDRSSEKLKKEQMEKTEASAELEKDCLAMAGIVNDRRKKSNRTIKEV